MLRAIELRLLRMAYNPLVKDPFVGCIFGLVSWTASRQKG